MQDMRAAVQYLKADFAELGNNYNIDTSRILIGGASSGAMTSMMTAYCDKESVTGLRCRAAREKATGMSTFNAEPAAMTRRCLTLSFIRGSEMRNIVPRSTMTIMDSTMVTPLRFRNDAAIPR
jgi:hypothetical protein